MKILIFAILIIYSSACKFIKRKKSIKFQNSQSCLLLNITDIKNKGKIYLHFSSKKGSMNEKIYFKFLKKANSTNSSKENPKIPYKKDVSKPKEQTSKTGKNKLTKISSQKREFHYYYEIEKQPGANFIYLRYTNFKGDSLEIENYEPSYFHVFIIIIGVVLVIILIIVCVCVGRYIYTKKQEAIMEENYKSSFVDDNNYTNSVY